MAETITGIQPIIPPSQNFDNWGDICLETINVKEENWVLSKKISCHGQSLVIIVPIMCASATLAFCFVY